jgi:hypothetical protein
VPHWLARGHGRPGADNDAARTTTRIGTIGVSSRRARTPLTGTHHLTVHPDGAGAIDELDHQPQLSAP